MTKQQTIELVDIDIKLLRWVSEIVSDGSEIRSLAGRSARLGDGTSRNPSDRAALMEQRTKDLAGMIGQVRGFDLDEFLSDWEPEGEALPWAIGDSSWVAEGDHSQEKTQPCEPGLAPAAGARVGSLKPVDQYHKVTGHPGDSAVDDISRSSEAEAQARKEDAAHDKNVRIAEIFWSGKAKEKDWDCIMADI